MGQQQLLLLVLGIVIVGIAVVAGIQAFSEGKTKAAQDAATSDAMRIVSDVQAWKMKPAAFGGGAAATTQPNFVQLGYPAAPEGGGSGVQSSSDTYWTISGCYTLAAPGEGGGIAALQLRLKNPSVNTGACVSDVYATVNINGTGVDDIEWVYGSGS